jgi:hypothetical protein
MIRRPSWDWSYLRNGHGGIQTEQWSTASFHKAKHGRGHRGLVGATSNSVVYGRHTFCCVSQQICGHDLIERKKKERRTQAFKSNSHRLHQYCVIWLQRASTSHLILHVDRAYKMFRNTHLICMPCIGICTFSRRASLEASRWISWCV